MIWTEINPEGNFNSWDKAKLKEVKEGNYSDSVGEFLYENREIILWEINLAPFQRLPFRRHSNNYSCTCFTNGLAVLRNVNGKISLARMEKGDHYYVECIEEEIIQDIENVGESAIKIAIVEEKIKKNTKAYQKN